jgi:DNA-binding response OmpR family regulator
MRPHEQLPVLLVDDDEPTRHLLRALMVRFGFVSEVAKNGREAIDCLRQRKYSAIVLDLMMPEVGGKSVIAYLESSGSATPVIVCTAAGPSATGDFNPDIVKAVVRKPFDIEQFIALLTTLVNRSEPAS